MDEFEQSRTGSGHHLQGAQIRPLGRRRRRAAERPSAAAGSAERAMRRWPAVTTTGSMPLSQPWRCGSTGRGVQVTALARRVGWREPQPSKQLILLWRKSRAVDVTRRGASRWTPWRCAPLANLKSLASRTARPAFVLARAFAATSAVVLLCPVGAGMRGRLLRHSQATIITSSRSSPRATRTAPG
jgi:hypothetical protein